MKNYLLRALAIAFSLIWLLYPQGAKSAPVVETEPPAQVIWKSQATKEEVKDLIKKYSSEFGIDATLPLAVAKCESGYQHWIKNPNSSASGVFQWIKSSWAGTPEGKAGYSVFDAEANIKAGVRSIASGGIGNWNASKACWNRNSN